MNLQEFREMELWKQIVTDDMALGGFRWEALVGFTTYLLVYKKWAGDEDLSYLGPTGEEIVCGAIQDLPETLAQEVKDSITPWLEAKLIGSGGFLEELWIYVWGRKFLPSEVGIETVERSFKEQGWELFPSGTVSPSFVARIREFLQDLCPRMGEWGPPTSLLDLHFPWFYFNYLRVEKAKEERRQEVERRRRLLEEAA